jgi:uncharacterized protein YjbJ (UPF0337 family)
MADNMWDETKRNAEDFAGDVENEYNRQKGRAEQAWDDMKDDNNPNREERNQDMGDDETTV